jgi:hypothetical protein
MFPNIRLLAVAVLAAIAGISCGLGLFATFRVNHEPLARLSEGGPPLQLALDRPLPRLEASPPPAVRYPLSAPIVIAAPVVAEPPSGVAADPGSTIAAVPASAPESSQDGAPESVPEKAALASAADQPAGPTIVAAAPDEPPSSVIESNELAPPAAAAAPDEPPSSVTESKELAPPAAAATPAEPPSNVTESEESESKELAAPTAAAAPDEPPSNVTESQEPAAPTVEAAASAGQTSNQPLSDRVASAEATPAAAETPRAAPVGKPEQAEKHAKPQDSKVVKPPAKITRAAPPAHRVAAKVVVRGRRTITTVAAVQPISQFSQTNYQWVDPYVQFQSPQAHPVRRVVIKRRQLVKPAAAPPAPQASRVPSATAGVLTGQ